jgi:lipopolysaccharide transport system ATP-binding protein
MLERFRAMSEKPILQVENLSKKFSLNLRRSMLYGTLDLLGGLVGAHSKQDQLRPAEFWVLKDVNFSLKQGDTLGLIGTNGSGKSTLLRVITGIYPPDQGRVIARGQVGALIALGAGFHPHMTGLENIYTNGTIMGMTRSQIKSRLEEIIDFSELGEFIHSPVSSYSSGMSARLGFSIAVNSRPDLLIVDEVLAVGDLAFAIKCHRKMTEYRQNGGTTILVSHSNQLIRNICKNVLWLNKGTVKAAGEAQEICSLYEAEQMRGVEIANSDGPRVMNYDPAVKIVSVEVLGENDQLKSDFNVGDEFKIRMTVESRRPVINPVFTISMHNAENIQVVSNHTRFDGWKVDTMSGRATMDFVIKRLTLNPSKYFISLTLSEREVNRHLEWHEKAYTFSVVKGPTSYGIFNPEPIWDFKNRGEA